MRIRYIGPAHAAIEWSSVDTKDKFHLNLSFSLHEAICSDLALILDGLNTQVGKLNQLERRRRGVCPITCQRTESGDRLLQLPFGILLFLVSTRFKHEENVFGLASTDINGTEWIILL
ncbi:unnamed protein product [Heterobilharzia americana]|nr:unnamed protein product [Heterobilharzia americana]CAH8643889.1 unnamed protein product [Heterobilharzia americana]